MLCRKLLFVAFLLFFSSCVSGSYLGKPSKVNHVYIEPVTNRTKEELVDIIFSRAANNAFYTDSRFSVDRKPIPDVTFLVKLSVDSISTYPVGFNENDVAIEYRMEVTSTVKLIKYGFKNPYKVFVIKRYDFYSAKGTPQDIETRRKECMERIAFQIFREVGERLIHEAGRN